jgi:Taurine catabolism dioxygenase TauD, TfdA family
MLNRWPRCCSKIAVRHLSRKIETKLPLRFLRDSDEKNFDPTTRQRADFRYDVDTGKPAHEHLGEERYQVNLSKKDGSNYVVDWADGVSAIYSAAWVEQTTTNWQKPRLSRELWTGLTESDLRNSEKLSLTFDQLIHDEGMIKALNSLYSYGILLVTDTPIDDGGAGIAALASALSGSSKKNLASASLLENYRQGGTEILLPNGTDGPLRTLYGSVWFTMSAVQAEGTSIADSAYGQGSLPLHTDMTYMLSPPGLQVFTMIQPAENGGDSIYADGFAAAELLRSEAPHAYHVLTDTVRRYHCIDRETGWYLEAAGPVIEERQGTVVSIRHNDLDRLPDLPPYSGDQVNNDTFYKDLADAHAQWDCILGRDSTRLVMKLCPGDTVVVANQVS